MTKFNKALTAQEIAELPDDQIDTSDIPELDEAFWKNAVVVGPDRTERVSLRVKRSTVETFRSTGKGWQTRMNAVLDSYAKTLRKGA